jgi:delta 1-pyrroline-5-carboxylate dehydrogenase
MIVHESIADEVLEKFTALSRTIRIGNPLDPLTEMGPLTSRQHRDRVLSFVDVAREQGGRVLAGGKAPDDAALANGCYVEPTIVEAKPEHRVSQEEVFGPFMTVTTCRRGSLDARPAARTPGGSRDSRRHGVDQLLQAREPRIAVRRCRRERLWPRDGF